MKHDANPRQHNAGPSGTASVHRPIPPCVGISLEPRPRDQVGSMRLDQRGCYAQPYTVVRVGITRRLRPTGRDGCTRLREIGKFQGVG